MLQECRSLTATGRARIMQVRMKLALPGALLLCPRAVASLPHAMYLWGWLCATQSNRPQPPNPLQSRAVAADKIEATLVGGLAPRLLSVSSLLFSDMDRRMQSSKAKVLPPALYLWPYSHLPVTGSQRPPISIAHLDCMFLQPLSANAAVDDTTIENAAIAAVVFIELQFIEIRPPMPRRAEHTQDRAWSIMHLTW